MVALSAAVAGRLGSEKEVLSVKNFQLKVYLEILSKTTPQKFKVFAG